MKKEFICGKCGRRWSMRPDRNGLFNGYGNPPCPDCGEPGSSPDDYGDFECMDCGHRFRRYGNGGLIFGCMPKCPKCGGYTNEV